MKEHLEVTKKLWFDQVYRALNSADQQKLNERKNKIDIQLQMYVKGVLLLNFLTILNTFTAFSPEHVDIVLIAGHLRRFQ